MDERSTPRTIADSVTAEGAAVALLERVRVVPRGVRAAQLDVHEMVRWIPFGDFRAPPDGKAVHVDAVINERAGPHLEGRGRQYFKSQPGRRDGFQVPRLSKEGKHLVSRARKPQFGLQRELLPRLAFLGVLRCQSRVEPRSTRFLIAANIRPRAATPSATGIQPAPEDGRRIPGNPNFEACSCRWPRPFCPRSAWCRSTRPRRKSQST
jgi:hypothetical protein